MNIINILGWSLVVVTILIVISGLVALYNFIFVTGIVAALPVLVFLLIFLIILRCVAGMLDD